MVKLIKAIHGKHIHYLIFFFLITPLNIPICKDLKMCIKGSFPKEEIWDTIDFLITPNGGTTVGFILHSIWIISV